MDGGFGSIDWAPAFGVVEIEIKQNKANKMSLTFNHAYKMIWHNCFMFVERIM